MKIGFICICTGKYINYLDQLLQSFIKNFIPESEKTFFVFTDNKITEYVNKYQTDKIKLIYIKQNQIGWPYDSLYRFKMITKNKEIIDKSRLDYMFFCNINLHCSSYISQIEIIPKQPGIIGCLHPGFFKKNKKTFTYETNPKSTAYVKNGNNYYQACFFGANYNIFMKMSEMLDKNITIDEKNNIIAVWHDESHLNRYFNDNKPIKTLNPNYAFPDEHHFYPNIRIFLNNIKIRQILKDHQKLRK